MTNGSWLSFKSLVLIRKYSERILYVDWDLWHPCDDPVSILFIPWYVTRAILMDMCCGTGGGKAEKAKEALRRRKEDRDREKDRSWLNKCCVFPVGRTANFIDIDIVADVGAHQRCSQLVLNEGDLLLHLLPGDASGDADADGIFYVRGVPEVFSTFDDLSYDLSKMDLKHYRQVNR